MATTDYSCTQLLADLSKGNYAPLYFLHGEEPYYIDLVADYLQEHLLDDMSREFDLTVVYGKDCERDLGPVITAARRYPMIAQHQLIIVKEAQNIRNWDALDIYLDNMMPSTVLVFCYKYGSPDGRKSVFANIKKKGGVMAESSKLRDYQVPDWIKKYIQDYNNSKKTHIAIDDKSINLLADSLGTDLQKIVGAINRLIAGLPEGKQTIDADLVERNIGISKDYNIFELQQAIINKDVLKANRIAQYFTESKDNAIQGKIPFLFSFFSNLLLYLYLPSSQKGENIVSQLLGINRYSVKDYAAAARNYSKGKVYHIIGYLRRADVRSKGFNNPSVTEGEIWQELLYQILH